MGGFNHEMYRCHHCPALKEVASGIASEGTCPYSEYEMLYPGTMTRENVTINCKVR